MARASIAFSVVLVTVLVLGVTGLAAASPTAEQVETDECGTGDDPDLGEVTNPVAGEDGADAEPTASVLDERREDDGIDLPVEAIRSGETVEPDVSRTAIVAAARAAIVTESDEQVVVDASESVADLVGFDVGDSGEFDRTTDQSDPCEPGDDPDAN